MRFARILKATFSNLPKIHNFVHPEDFYDVFARPQILSKFFTDFHVSNAPIKNIEILGTNKNYYAPTIFTQYYDHGEKNLAAIQCAATYCNHLIASYDITNLLQFASEHRKADLIVVTRDRTGLFVDGTREYSTDLLTYGDCEKLSRNLNIKTSLTIFDLPKWRDLKIDEVDFSSIDFWMEFFNDPDSGESFIGGFAPEICPEIFYQKVEVTGENAPQVVNDPSVGT